MLRAVVNMYRMFIPLPKRTGLWHLRGLGVSLGRIFGGPSIEPFLGEEVSPEGCIVPPPPELKTRPPKHGCDLKAQLGSAANSAKNKTGIFGISVLGGSEKSSFAMYLFGEQEKFDHFNAQKFLRCLRRQSS